MTDQESFCEFTNEELFVLWLESRDRFYRALTNSDEITLDRERDLMYDLFNEMVERGMI